MRCTVPGSVTEPVLEKIGLHAAPLIEPQRYERIAERLAADIRAGRLAPGAQLPAHDAGPFDLIEARLLLEPGVAALAARRGRTDAEAEQLLDAMDAAAAGGDRGGWNEGDRRFHRRLAALTANPVLLALADEIATLMDQPLWQRLRDDSIAQPGRARIHAAEHRMIYEAIVDGDASAASFYATQHLERVRRYMTTDQEN